MGKNGGACGGVLHMRGGYRDSDIVRHYVLVMTPAPQGVEEHELLGAVHVLSTRLAPLHFLPPSLPSSSCCSHPPLTPTAHSSCLPLRTLK